VNDDLDDIEILVELESLATIEEMDIDVTCC